MYQKWTSQIRESGRSGLPGLQMIAMRTHFFRSLIFQGAEVGPNIQAKVFVFGFSIKQSGEI